VGIVQYLCEHGALLDLQDNNGNTAVHVSNSHLDVTRVLVQKGANLCAAEASGSTALHIAAKSGYLNILQYLADSFAPTDMRNTKKETALLVAAAEGHEKIVRFLIELGAGIGVRDIRGENSPRHSYSKRSHRNHTGAKGSSRRKEARLASIPHIGLSTDSEVGNVEHLHLMNAMACVGTETDRNGNYAARMLKSSAEDTLEVHSKPRSTLHTAAVNGNLKEVQRMVEAGTAPDYCDNFGRTAVWAAAQRGHKSITRFLLENSSCVNMPDCEGLTPVDIAARERNWHAFDEFLEHDPIIRPEGIEYLTNQLFEASESGDLECADDNNCGINVDTTNKNGYTPLHVGAKYGHIEITRILLKSCASVNMADPDGRTPINLAAINGHIEIF
jgi:ankyrin repeat protein